MGTGIAQTAATSGFDVILNDIKDELLERSLKAIDKSLTKFQEKVNSRKTRNKLKQE